jgi:hypothetical protein
MDLGAALVEVARNFHPVWVLAIFVASALAWRAPETITAILTGIREHKRVNADIARKQHETAVRIAAKLKRKAMRKKLRAV